LGDVMDREQIIIDVFIERDNLKEQYEAIKIQYKDLSEAFKTLVHKYEDLEDACEVLKAELMTDIHDNDLGNSKGAIDAIILMNRAKDDSK